MWKKEGEGGQGIRVVRGCVNAQCHIWDKFLSAGTTHYEILLLSWLKINQNKIQYNTQGIFIFHWAISKVRRI